MAATVATRLRTNRRPIDSPATQRRGLRRRHQHLAGDVSGHTRHHAAPHVPRRPSMPGHFRRVCIWCCSCIESPGWSPVCISGCALRRMRMLCDRRSRRNSNGKRWTDSGTSAPLYRLGGGDLRDFARTLSCQQNIAADGAFSLGMLARFEPVCGSAARRLIGNCSGKRE